MRAAPDGRERLAALFDLRRRLPGPPGVRADHRDDPPTVPLPVVPFDDRASLVGRIGTGLRRFVPAGWFAARVDPGRPGATALALVAAVAALVAAAGVWSQRPRAEPVDALPTVSVAAPGDARPVPQAAPGAGAAAAASGSIVVSVVGKVRSPGLVTVPDGSRVADALAAAGGALPGVDPVGLNLARRLADGEQIAVGVAASPDATSPGSAGGPAVATGSAAGGGAPTAGAAGGEVSPVDLNRATAAQLDTLPGVGPVTAARIIEWRTRNGPFRRVEQLREIEGIGERRFTQLRGRVTVS